MGKSTDAGGFLSNLYIFIVRTKFSLVVCSTVEANQIKKIAKKSKIESILLIENNL